MLQVLLHGQLQLLQLHGTIRFRSPFCPVFPPLPPFYPPLGKGFSCGISTVNVCKGGWGVERNVGNMATRQSLANNPCSPHTHNQKNTSHQFGPHQYQNSRAISILSPGFLGCPCSALSVEEVCGERLGT